MTKTTDDVLDRVLGPVDVERFFESYWERQPLHVARGDGAHFANLLTLSEIERLLSSGALSFPDAQLSRSRDPVAPEDYTDGERRIVPSSFIRHHAAGATIVISQAQRFVGALGELCRDVQRRLGMRCQTNLYLSPPESQGFGAHYDSHDVLILQIGGRKAFRFYAGGPELPLVHDRFDPATCVPGAKAEEIPLEAGDTLYIPRGVMHDAVASGEAPSLHVTLGLFPTSVHEVLRETLRVASEREISLRRAVGERPRVTSGERRVSIEAGAEPPLADLRALLDTVFSAENVAEAMSRLRDDLSMDGLPDCTGSLSRLARQAELDLDSCIVLRAGAVTGAEREADGLRLRTLGQVLELRDPMGRAVEPLLDGRRERVGALPGLDDEQRLTLGRRLLRENVVEIADAAPSDRNE